MLWITGHRGSPGDNTMMMHFFVPFILALATAFRASLGHTEVRIGLAAPLTGPMAWAGDQIGRGAETAVADLNAKGGVLGETVELITADDYCDSQQAVAAANKLIAAGVVAVVGHVCSGAATPASKLYSGARLLMISNFATNPKLTEQGFTTVFRVVGRDDLQGRIAGDLLAEHWGNKPIAVLHDGQAYSRGLAEETKKRLNARGVAEAMFKTITPGMADYWDVVQAMRSKGIEVLYYGGYSAEAALIIRQARQHGYELQLVTGDGVSNEDFGLIAGPSSDGTLMTYPPVPANAQAAELRRRFPDLIQPPFQTYATFQVWAQAVEIAGTFESKAVSEALRTHEFETVLGRIGSTPRATSPATRLSSGTSGKTASTRRWNRTSLPSDGRRPIVLWVLRGLRYAD
jgi:branched-chain amino acid transport system substrate-binding protein